jgi:hypothetical protein
VRRLILLAALALLTGAPVAAADENHVLCPIGGGMSEIVPKSECPERPHKTRERDRRRGPHLSNPNHIPYGKSFRAETDRKCTTPEAYRQGCTPTVQPVPTANCLIKGNKSRNGWIYHTPESPWYEATIIDEEKGERWFCSEAEARAAGWRAPR